MRKRITVVNGAMQYRAEDLKSLEEQRNEAVQAMKDITAKAETEQRALDEAETAKFDELEKTVKDIDASIERMQRARDIQLNVVSDSKKAEAKKEELEERAFEAYIRNTLEARADENLTFGDNGAVVPTTIANKIIKKVHEISPLYNLATVYSTKGTLEIPYYPADAKDIQMAYSDEFTELESTAGKFGSISLKGFLAGALAKISKTLINNSQFDIVNHVIDIMSENIALWLEGQLINGTENKADGMLKGITETVKAAAATAITADELIDLQESVKDVYQNKAVWIMSRNTRRAIRKLKDNEGRYILNPDATSKWGYTLFGKPVYVSENMADMAAGATPIVYGDMSGLAVKMTENMEIQVLREKFATQHAVGVVAWTEFDAKVENAQKLAKLMMADA